MRKVCSWCGSEMPEVDEPISVEGLDIEGQPISHGMCDECFAAVVGDDVMGPPHRLYDEDQGW